MDELSIAMRMQGEVQQNGLALNGLSSNGLSRNGLSRNGLSRNGLSRNGLASADFSSWFLGQTEGTGYSDMVMRYLVKCAAPSNTVLSATVLGITYSWPGGLGLAPTWVAGNPIPPAEQEIMTACLAAHVNKFGAHVVFSLLGFGASGAAIPLGANELKSFAVKEGCFFGNLFTDDGVLVGNDSIWGGDKSSVRDCAIAMAGKSNNNCPPMIFAGECNKLCVVESKTNAYRSCSFNGKSYAALNSRIVNTDIYQCGDHICQLSESCGTGNTPGNCKDCGPCP
jgi:hypothetical protein